MDAAFILVEPGPPPGPIILAGDDAADVGWFDREELADLSLTDHLVAQLDEFGVFDGSS